MTVRTSEHGERLAQKWADRLGDRGVCVTDREDMNFMLDAIADEVDRLRASQVEAKATAWESSGNAWLRSMSEVCEWLRGGRDD